MYKPYDIRRRYWLDVSDSLMGWCIGIGAWLVILWLVWP
jgi:hypothetical protein